MKRKIVWLAAIAILITLSAERTLAYFTAETVAHNVITSGSVQIALLEWGNEEKTVPFPEEGLTGVMPGKKITKIAEVQNTGSASVYVRVKLEKLLSLSGEQDAEGASSYIALDVNEEYWQLQDGFYYYKEQLEPGEVSRPLFTTVHFALDMDDRYQESRADIVVKAYAVQSAHNGSTVMDAAGWPQVE